MKRFTETNKWRDPWFRKLPPTSKLLWHYLVDNCDQAGVVEVDWELASFQIGDEVTESDLVHFEKHVTQLPSGKLWMPGFVKFQYGKLSRACKPHAPVFEALSRHGIHLDDVDQNDEYTRTVSREVRQKIIDRDGPVCAYTGVKIEESEIEIDHVVPRHHGGTAEPDNLVVACNEINQKKSDTPLEPFCRNNGLDFQSVVTRISSRTGKPLNELLKLLKRVQEKEEEKEKDQEKEGGGKENPDDVFSKIQWPEPLNTSKFKTSFRRWIAVRMAEFKQPKRGWMELFKGHIDQCASWGEEGAIRSLTASSNGPWQGLFEPRYGSGNNGNNKVHEAMEERREKFQLAAKINNNPAHQGSRAFREDSSQTLKDELTILKKRYAELGGTYRNGLATP